MDLGKKIFVIYPVGSQLFHRKNKEIYNYLVTKYGGNEVYISTTDEQLPFSFDERSKMITLTGVPLSRIIKSKSKYSAKNLVGKIPININRDSIIFAVGEKDIPKDPYLQPIPKNLDKLQPAITFGYIDIAPSTDATVFGMPVRNESELKKQYVSLNPQQRKQFIKDLFGKYDESIYTIMNNKFGVNTGTLTEKQKKLLKKLIVGVLKENDAKINAARKKWNQSGLVLRAAELEAAEEELKKAEEALKNSTTPEEKAAAELNVTKKKAERDSKKAARDAALHQMKST